MTIWSTFRVTICSALCDRLKFMQPCTEGIVTNMLLLRTIDDQT